MADIVKENSDVRKGKCYRQDEKNDEDAQGILIVMGSVAQACCFCFYCSVLCSVLVLRFGTQCRMSAQQ